MFCPTHTCLTPPMLVYGENCVILTSTVYDLSTRVTDGQTDGRTYEIAVAYTRYADARKRKKNIKLKNKHTTFPINMTPAAKWLHCSDINRVFVIFRINQCPRPSCPCALVIMVMAPIIRLLYTRYINRLRS